jgi:hypothetical protein
MTPVFPPPDHPAWLAFLDGYLAGITHGVGMGRAQISQEYAHAEIFPDETPPTPSHASVIFAAHGLSRHEVTHLRAAQRQAARTEYTGPNLTGEQIREKGYQSWGLIDVARWNAAA